MKHISRLGFVLFLVTSTLITIGSVLAQPVPQPLPNDFFTSRYYGRTFPKNGGDAQCKDELESVRLKLWSNKLEILSAKCVQGMGGIWSVQVDYAHPFGKSIESFKKDVSEACDDGGVKAAHAFEKAELSVISYSCAKGQGGGNVRIDYIRNGKRIIDEYEHFASRTTRQECELDLLTLSVSFDSAASITLLGSCQALRYGLSETVYYRAMLTHAIELGKSVELMSGAESTDLVSCALSANDVAHRFNAAGFKALASGCARVQNGGAQNLYREHVTYLDALLPRVRTYHGIGSTTFDACMDDAKTALNTHEKLNRPVLHSFCRLTQGFGSPARYVPTLYFVEPKIVLPPAPPAPAPQ